MLEIIIGMIVAIVILLAAVGGLLINCNILWKKDEQSCNNEPLFPDIEERLFRFARVNNAVSVIASVVTVVAIIVCVICLAISNFDLGATALYILFFAGITFIISSSFSHLFYALAKLLCDVRQIKNGRL